MQNFMLYVVGWLLIIVTLWGMAKFSPTRVVLYWLLWISIVWLLIVNSEELSSLMNGVFQSSGVNGSSGSWNSGSGSSGSSGDFGNITNAQSQTSKGK